MTTLRIENGTTGYNPDTEVELGSRVARWIEEDDMRTMLMPLGRRAIVVPHPEIWNLCECDAPKPEEAYR